MLKGYLKQICNLESEIQEKSLKLDKAKVECEKAQKRISDERERLRLVLKDKKAKLEALESKRKKAAQYTPEGIFSTVIIFLITIAITLLLGLGIKALVISAFGATDAASATTAYMIINILPVLAIWFFVCIGDEFTWGKTALFIGIHLFISLLTYGYFSLFENKEKSISYAMMFFMIILIILEIVIGFITCLIVNNKQEKRYFNNRRWLRESEKELAKLKQDVQLANDMLSKYIINSQTAVKNMLQDIECQEQVLYKTKLNLRNLYAKNTLHPNYQNWVAAATIYEYLDTGRCSELTGYTGAYNLYEKELIAKQILSSLSAIKSSIQIQGDRIVGSQHYIRNQLIECNRKLNNYKFNTRGY